MMGIAMKYYFYCSIVSSVMLLLLWPAVVVVVCYTQDTTFVSSRATYYGSPDCLGTPSMCIYSLDLYTSNVDTFKCKYALPRHACICEEDCILFS